MNPIIPAVATAGTGIGGGIAIWAILRFIKWGIEYVSGRLDIRTDRLAERELEIEERFNARLRHVEIELDRFRMATMRLVNRMAEVIPHDPVLIEVAHILRSAVPIPPEDADLDKIAAQAEEAVRRATR